MLTWILASLLGGGCFLLLMAVLAHIAAKDNERLERMNARFRGADRYLERVAAPEASDLLKKKTRARRHPAKKVSSNSVKRLLSAGSFWLSSPKRFIYFLIVSSAISLAIWVFSGLPVSTSVIGGTFAFVTSNNFLRKRKLNKRKEAIEERVPEVMEMIVRSLRVGTPISAAMAQVGRDLKGPLAEEFALASQEIAYGKDMNIALRELAGRCGNQDLHFFATAVAIQSGTGGNLAEVIARLAQITRGRFQLKRKISAITGEAKWSGKFLSAFPIFACMALLIVNPDYFIRNLAF